MSHTLGFNVIPAPHLMRGIQPFHWFPVFTGTSLDSRFHGNDRTPSLLSFLRKQESRTSQMKMTYPEPSLG